jgi:hypothetical protein
MHRAFAAVEVLASPRSSSRVRHRRSGIVAADPTAQAVG